MEIKEVTLNGISTTLIKTSKFKTINIHVVFLGNSPKKQRPGRVCLPESLPTRPKNIPRKSARDETPGSLRRFSGRCDLSERKDFRHRLQHRNRERKKPRDQGLTKEAVELLWEVIFNPNLENGLFSEKDFLEQKRLLRERLNNVYNNKTRYALREMLKKMAPEEIISASSLGSLEDLEKVTNEDLVAQYKEMLEKENVSLYVCGDFEEESMLRDLSLLGEIKSQPHEHETVLTEPVRVKRSGNILKSRRSNKQS